MQATDQHLACDQIQAEAKINNDRITALAKEQGWKVGQNVAAGVIGLVIWPVWFGMDFQDAAGKGSAVHLATKRVPHDAREDPLRGAIRDGKHSAKSTTTILIHVKHLVPQVHAAIGAGVDSRETHPT